MEYSPQSLPDTLSLLARQGSCAPAAPLRKPEGDRSLPTLGWVGGEDEDVVVSLFKGTRLEEDFHRQDFFFFDFVYRGSYHAAVGDIGNRVAVREGQLCACHPNTGFAADVRSADPVSILCVGVRSTLFQKNSSFVQALGADAAAFCLSPTTRRHSDFFVQVNAAGSSYPYLELLRTMAGCYASCPDPRERQAILQPLALTLAGYAARHGSVERGTREASRIVSQIEDAIREDLGAATLESVAARCAYHPSYLSRLIKKETGETFLQIRTRLRIDEATRLLRETDLSVEAVAAQIGFASVSSFYKAFRTQVGSSPRAAAIAW